MFAATDRYPLRRSLPCLCIMGRVTGQARANCYSGASPRQTNGLPRPDWMNVSLISIVPRRLLGVVPRHCLLPAPSSEWHQRNVHPFACSDFHRGRLKIGIGERHPVATRPPLLLSGSQAYTGTLSALDLPDGSVPVD
jgi:hypothetical protein